MLYKLKQPKSGKDLICVKSSTESSNRVLKGPWQVHVSAALPIPPSAVSCTKNYGFQNWLLITQMRYKVQEKSDQRSAPPGSVMVSQMEETWLTRSSPERTAGRRETSSASNITWSPFGNQLECMSYLLPLPKSHHMPVESDHERVLLTAKVNGEIIFT